MVHQNRILENNRHPSAFCIEWLLFGLKLTTYTLSPTDLPFNICSRLCPLKLLLRFWCSGSMVAEMLSKHITWMVGGTSGLLLLSSLVRNSSFFSSSHSLYVPISKYLVIASSASECLPDSCCIPKVKLNHIIQAPCYLTTYNPNQSPPDASQASLIPFQKSQLSLSGQSAGHLQAPQLHKIATK